MKGIEQCETHEAEIKQIKSDFSSFKSDIYSKIDELMEEVRKPILSDVGWARLTIATIVYTILIAMYIGNTNSQAQTNKEDIIEIKSDYNNIIDHLLEIKEDIGKNKGNK